jgi:hypothetical protein
VLDIKGRLKDKKGNIKGGGKEKMLIKQKMLNGS